MNDESNPYEAWLRTLRGLHLDDKDAVVVITGKERKGKSTLAWTVAQRVDEGFGPDRMVFSGQDFMRAAVALPKGSALVLDEAVQGGFSRDAMTEKNRSLTKFLVVAGERNLVSFILFPNIRWLDPYIAEHRARWWILIEKRGQALVHEMRAADYRGAKPSWKRLFRIRFKAVEGDDWSAYLKAKSKLVRNEAKKADGQTFVPDDREVESLSVKFQTVIVDEG